MCNTKYQQDCGLADGDIVPGVERPALESKHAGAGLRAAARQRSRSARAAPPIERQLADGRWLQVNELRTRDGGTVSVGSDITQLKLHQEKLVDSERRLMATIHDLSLARKAEQERASELVELNKKYMRETERAEAGQPGQVRVPGQHVARAAHAAQRHHRLFRADAVGLFGPLGSERYSEYATDIHRSGNYLLGVINDILDMSKIEAGQFSIEREEVDLCPLIRETVRVVSLQAAQKSITVETKIADTMPLYRRPPRDQADRPQSAVQRGQVHRRGRPYRSAPATFRAPCC